MLISLAVRQFSSQSSDAAVPFRGVTEMAIAEREKFALGTWDIVAVATYFSLILGVGLSVSPIENGEAIIEHCTDGQC